MALPSDFWRNDQLLNIFRTRPCTRFQRFGHCEWKSQCQFSHCLDWPRRSSARQSYSAELCKTISMSNGDNENRKTGRCSKEGSCSFAHSKEEVLYHPHLFKTILCEEFESTSDKGSGVKGKQVRCHRYYCPFAHGPEELRKSPLVMSERQALIQAAIEKFSGDDCCGICSPSRAVGGTPQSLPSDSSSPLSLQSSPPRKHTYSNGKGGYSPNFQHTDESTQGNQYMSYRGGWTQGTQVSSGCMGEGAGCSPIAQNLFGQSGNESSSGHQDGCTNGQMQSPLRPVTPMGQVFQLVQMPAGGMSPCMTDSQGCMSMMQMVPMSPPQGPVQTNGSMQVIQFSPSLPGTNQLTSQEGQAATPAHNQEDAEILLRNAGIGHLAEPLKALGYETTEELCSLSDDLLDNMGFSPNDQLSLCRVVEKCKERRASWQLQQQGVRQGVSMQPAMQPAMMVGACNGYPCMADNSYQVMWSPPQVGFQPQPQQNSPAQYVQVPPFPYPDQVQQSGPQEATPPRASKEAATPPQQNGKGRSAGFTPSPPPVPALPWKSHGQAENGKNGHGHGSKTPSKFVKRKSQQEQPQEKKLEIMNN